MDLQLYKEALPYFKQTVRGETADPEIALTEEDSMVQVDFVDDLIITFLVDDPAAGLFKYVQNGELPSGGEELLNFAVGNLYRLVEEHGLRMRELGDDCFALLLDGNFEASLLLLDDVWDHTLIQFAPDGYAAAIPSRDVLAFCNAGSDKGTRKLESIICSVWENGDYLLSDKVLKREEGKWLCR